MATLSGTHTVDGASPAADRFVVYTYNYNTRAIANADSLAGSSNVAADGTWEITGLDAHLHVCIVVDTTDVKAPVLFEETAA